LDQLKQIIKWGEPLFLKFVVEIGIPGHLLEDFFQLASKINYSSLEVARRSLLQARQAARLLAFRVPQPLQRMYIAEANQFVIRALETRIPPSTAIVSNVSFNSLWSPNLAELD
jgi:hypothetical protein